MSEAAPDSSAALPDPASCSAAEHVGRLHHDDEHDIWYECVYDPRHGVFTWSALPTAD